MERTVSPKSDVASSRKGRPKKVEQSDITTLRQEVKRLWEENEILKKAAVMSEPTTDHEAPVLLPTITRNLWLSPTSSRVDGSG